MRTGGEGEVVNRPREAFQAMGSSSFGRSFFVHVEPRRKNGSASLLKGNDGNA